MLVHEKIKLVVFLVMNVVVFPAYAVDIGSLDIANIKLGMTFEQSTSSVKSYMKITDGDIVKGFPKENPISGKSEPSYFSVKRNGSELLVHFTPNVTDVDHPNAIVSQISYKLPWTPDNVESMKKSALKKYPKPSYVMGNMYSWCKNPNPVQGCVGGDQLKLYGASLDMYDLKYNQALVKYKQSSNRVSPGF